MKKTKYCFIAMKVLNLIFSFSWYTVEMKGNYVQFDATMVVAKIIVKSYHFDSTVYILLFIYIIICYFLEVIFIEGGRLREKYELTV